MARRHDGWTIARRQRFLAVLAETANVTAACVAVRKDKSGAYALRRRDADFAERWEEAIAVAIDELIAVAVDRARSGTERQVVRASGEVVAIREYSDRLLMYLLSRRQPLVHARMTHRGPVDMSQERDICARIEANIAAIEAELRLK